MRKTLGRSVYLTAFEKQAASLAVCPAGGAPVFLSLYITEEFSSEYVHRAAEICHWLAAQGWQVLADISRRTLAVFEEPNAAALANQDVLIVHAYAGTAKTAVFAERYSSCMVKPSSLGGEGGGFIGMPIDVTFGGTRTIGTAAISGNTVTFTEGE